MPVKGFRQKFAKKMSPVALPEVFEVPWLALSPESISEVIFARLNLPNHSEVALLHSSEIKEIDLLSKPHTIDISTEFFDISENIEIDALLKYPLIIGDALSQLSAPPIIKANGTSLLPPIPEIEDLFTPLSRPKLAGKDYREDKSQVGANKKSINSNLRGSPIDLTKHCPHGISQALCNLCKSFKRKVGPSAKNQVDVFDQLRHVLMPSLLDRLADPELFPGGKRPYPFQISGIKWLVQHKEALLADEMGLGKSIQAIVALRVLLRQGQITNVFIVSPKSLVGDWERKIRDWAPELTITRLEGNAGERQELWNSQSDIIIASYDAYARIANNLPKRRFGLCILDEAQYIKNPGSQRSRAIRRIEADYRWALTGTPLENKPEDTVGIFQFILPKLFNRDAKPTSAQLRKTIRPYTLRRTVNEVELDLPTLNIDEKWLELNERQRATYERVETGGIEELKAKGSEATRVHVFALINRLKQICNYDETTGESTKLTFMKEELESVIANNDKALIFSQYPNKTLSLIEPQLKKFSPAKFDGSLSATQRDSVIDNFQSTEENSVLLMGVKAGGVGITLTRANHVFHFDQWWNPATTDQASARAHRIGQEKPVFATSLYTLDTIEERVAELLKRKRRIFSEVFDEINDDLLQRSVTDDELFKLFGLSAPKKNNNKVASQETPSGIDFERQIQRLFNGMGYQLEITPASNDGGIDLIGTRQGIGSVKVAVQCKRYKNSVSSSEVRDFWGATSGGEFGERFFVTTGRFSRQARKFANGKALTLVDGTYLEALTAQYGS